MAIKPLIKPTGSSVSQLHSRLLTEWNPRLGLDKEFQAIIRGTNPIETLPESPDRNMTPVEIHAGRAGGIIEHGNGLLMAMPSFHAEPPTQNTLDTREAESMERAAARLFEQQLLANDFWPAIGRDILSYGRSFVKSMLAMSEWTAQAGYPVRDQGEPGKKYLERIRKWKEGEGSFPFIIRHIPALSVLPMLDGSDNVLATIEEKFVSAKVLADDMGSEEVKEELTRGSLKWYDQLMVVEYIDTEWVGYFLAGLDPKDRAFVEEPHRRQKAYKALRVWQHNLGKHPVVMIPGIVTGDRELLHRYKSFLHDAKDALELYDLGLSRLACADADEKLLLADGTEKTYGELARNRREFEVLVPQGRAYRWGMRGKAWASASFSGMDKVYEVELESGTRLRRNSHHKLQVIGDQGLVFKNIDSLVPGDKVVALNNFNTLPVKDTSISPDIALLIGAVLGDGYLKTKGMVVLACENEVLRQLYINTAQMLGQPITISDRHLHFLSGRRKRKAPLWKALIQLDLFGQRAYTKKLPYETRFWPQKVAGQLLKGLLLADGWISSGGLLNFTSKSCELRDWVAFVAHRL